MIKGVICEKDVIYCICTFFGFGCFYGSIGCGNYVSFVSKIIDRWLW